MSVCVCALSKESSRSWTTRLSKRKEKYEREREKKGLISRSKNETTTDTKYVELSRPHFLSPRPQSIKKKPRRVLKREEAQPDKKKERNPDAHTVDNLKVLQNENKTHTHTEAI